MQVYLQLIKVMRQVVAWQTEVFTLDCTLRMSKPNTTVAYIELRVESTNEHITKDPQWTGRRRNVKAKETTQTDGLTHLTHGQHVIFTLQRERPTTNSKVDWWQCWNLLTVDHVLSFHQRCGTNLSIQLANLISRACNQ